MSVGHMNPPFQPGTTAFQNGTVPATSTMDEYLGGRFLVYDQVNGTRDHTELRMVKNTSGGAVNTNDVLLISADGTEVTGTGSAAAYNTVLPDPQLAANGVTTVAANDIFYVVGYGFAVADGATIAAGVQVAAGAAGVVVAVTTETDEEIIGESRGDDADGNVIVYVYRKK